MPRLDEARPALLQILFDQPPPADQTTDPTRPFASIARVAIGLLAEPRIAQAAIKALDEAGLLDPARLAEVELLEIDELFLSSKIRMSSQGFRPLQRIARWAADRGFDTDHQADHLSTEAIREAWRSLNGVGPTRADKLLLFGLGRPTYPIDRGTYRILVRHAWLDSSADYDEARSVAETLAPDEPEMLAGISVAFERIARNHCKPSVARCDQCPLQAFLPADGPVSMED